MGEVAAVAGHSPMGQPALRRRRRLPRPLGEAGRSTSTRSCSGWTGLIWQNPRRGFSKGRASTAGSGFPDRLPAGLADPEPGRGRDGGEPAAGRNTRPHHSGQGRSAAMLQQFLAQQGIPSRPIPTPHAAQSIDLRGCSRLPGAVAGWKPSPVTSRTSRTIEAQRQLLGYTTAANIGSYEAAVPASGAAFNRLTDQASLGGQPVRLKLVRLSRDMTVDDFDRQYPSAVPDATIALINGAASPADLLKAGKWAKRVRSGYAAARPYRLTALPSCRLAVCRIAVLPSCRRADVCRPPGRLAHL